MIYVILVEPEQPGNVGAVARVMKNFGFSKLVLVKPLCNHLCEEAINRSKWGRDVLKKAKVVKALPKLDYLIATTAKTGTDFNIPRSSLTPAQLVNKIPNNNIGLVFGREGIGLRNNEIMSCDFTVTIPTSSKYPTLNISHSVAIILYELTKHHTTLSPPQASRKDKEVLFNYINKALNNLKFSTKEKKETQRRVWKRVIGKALLTKREAMALMGFFRKIK